MSGNSKHGLNLDSAVPETTERPGKIAKTQDLCDDNVEEEEAESLSACRSSSMNPNPRIQRYLIAVEYIGSRFCGSQKQLNGRTVVGVLEEAFHKFIGQPVAISLSSRTDAGVHALSNVCHVDVERISKRNPGDILTPHEPAVVRRAVNHFLQKNEGDIMITDVRCVPADFHARFKAQERTYFYRLLSGPEPLSAFEKDRAWYVPEELDLSGMQEASKILVGHHDFTSFRASGCQAKSPVKTLDELSVLEVAPTPYFPSARERKQHSSIAADQDIGSSIPSNDAVEHFNGGPDLEFGMKRRHRCIVVTARAHSFLYHQIACRCSEIGWHWRYCNLGCGKNTECKDCDRSSSHGSCMRFVPGTRKV